LVAAVHIPIGAALDSDDPAPQCCTFAAFFANEMRNAGVTPLLADKPEGLEVTLRDGPRARLLFVLNTTHEPVTVRDVPEGEVVVGDAPFSAGAVTLPGYGSLILKLQH
jgi:glycosyl hydrolase family 42 (putative beta-galactosidase)